MAVFQIHKIIKNKKGQSTVEYILLLGLLSSLVFVVFKNSKFKTLFQSDAGLFSTMRKGMSYTYRFGREYRDSAEYDNAFSFEYTNGQHPLYFNKEANTSRFFSGTTVYGE